MLDICFYILGATCWTGSSTSSGLLADHRLVQPRDSVLDFVRHATAADRESRAPEGYGGDVPTWDSNPETWNDYVADCRWYVAGLREKDRPLAAARLHRRLRGAAKRFVQHLDASEFDSDGRREAASSYR